MSMVEMDDKVRPGKKSSIGGEEREEEFGSYSSPFPLPAVLLV